MTEPIPISPFAGCNAQQIPNRVYSDASLFQREMETFFYKGHWCYVALECEVPNAGDYKATMIGERPVIVVRDRDGSVHVLENRCAHKGAKFCQKEFGNAKVFVCPYHQWGYRLNGDLAGVPLPIIGGHEGAGIVQEVGPGVRDLKPGDHVVTSFLPACGRCRFCSTGHQNLCDLGALIMAGTQADGTHRRRARGQNVGVMAFVGTFSQYGTVPEASIVKIDDDLPLSRACLLGCGVTTGWGSAVNTADVSPGDTVVVIGLGGIGSGAVQGARLAGAEKIIVIDPIESKRAKATEFGATHFVTSMPEAMALVADLTRWIWLMLDDSLRAGGVYLAADEILPPAAEIAENSDHYRDPARLQALNL